MEIKGNSVTIMFSILILISIGVSISWTNFKYRVEQNNKIHEHQIKLYRDTVEYWKIKSYMLMEEVKNQSNYGKENR
jgi:hypothetical protein